MAKKTGFVPMSLHKNLLIRGLMSPMGGDEYLKMIFPEGEFKTAKEAAAWLKSIPGEWLVGGSNALRTTEEHIAYMKKTYNFDFKP